MKKSVGPSESPDEAVRRIVANQEQCHPSELGKLSSLIDINRLENLENPPIEFEYCGYELEVQADETIIIEP
jgi:hypothetical protein